MRWREERMVWWELMGLGENAWFSILKKKKHQECKSNTKESFNDGYSEMNIEGKGQQGSRTMTIIGEIQKKKKRCKTRLQE
jgi:hypothetical protein